MPLYMSLREKWNDEQWDKFFSIHEEILSLILKGLYIEVTQEYRQQHKNSI